MDPLVSIAITPKTKTDRERLAIGLQTLMTEDPAIRIRTDPLTGAIVVGGAGEQHLEIIVHRLAREFSVEANVGRPEVAYKETVTRAADGERKVAAIVRGRREYGHAKVHVSPGEPGSGYVFENTILGGAIPERFIPSVDEGIRGALAHGVLAGHPVVDVRVELYDGSYHDLDSSELAFQIAGSLAFQNAAKQAKPVLLEPIMLVDVRVPADSLGTVIEGLRQRRGQILSEDARDDATIVAARVPLSAMFGYATDLSSRTRGRGDVAMRLDGYAEITYGEDAGADALGVPAIPRRPIPTLGPLRVALPEPPEEQV